MQVSERGAAIHRFVRGNSSLRFSSSQLFWPGAVIEQHEAPAGERQETTIDSSLLVLYQGQNVVPCDRLDARRPITSFSVQPRAIVLYPPDILPPVRSSESATLLICELDRKILCETKDEMTDERTAEVGVADGVIAKHRSTVFDPPMRQILLLLGREAKTGGQSGRFYAEHLLQALVARLLFPRPKDQYKKAARYGLPPRILRRLLDRIKSDPLAHFDLTSLAAETGYSKRHFLRTFRVSTGLSPYQYILRVRLERARQLMHERSLTLLDIALESGFTSNAHFSNVFRQHFGVTPSHFRRAL
jgi:AraC family transcriptional regulator